MILTDEIIEKMEAPLKDKKIADKHGMCLNLRPSGKKVFVFRYQWRQKPQSIVIGRWPALSLEAARAIALNFRNQVDNDIDPRISKNRVKATAVKKHDAMAAFIDSYLDYLLVCAPHIPMKDVYTELKNMYISKLREYDVVDALQEDLKEMIE